MPQTDRLVDELREAIIKGTFVQGQPLRQDEIAKAFGTSKIPVREALRYLEGAGYVTSIPNRGLVVAEMSASELNELCEIRVDLETRALRAAIPKHTTASLKEAARVLDESDRDAQYLAHWSARNWAFHRALYEPAQRPLLLSTIEDLNRKTERYLQMHVSVFRYREQGQTEHRAILRACKRKDVKTAVKLLTAHISDVNALLAPILAQRSIA